MTEECKIIVVQVERESKCFTLKRVPIDEFDPCSPNLAEAYIESVSSSGTGSETESIESAHEKQLLEIYAKK